MPPTESPTVIKSGDKQSHKLLNLRDRTDLPVEEIENRMNNLHSLSSLMKLPSFAEEEKISILTRKQQFKHFLGKENKDCNIEKLMSLLSLETIPIRRVGSDGRIADRRGKIFGPEEDVDNVEKEGLSLGIGLDDPYYKNSKSLDLKSGQNTGSCCNFQCYDVEFYKYCCCCGFYCLTLIYQAVMYWLLSIG